MTTPVTEIDARFSDPGSTAAEWNETRAAIDAAELFWISTVRSDGRPHVTPLVAVWLDGAIHFCTGPGEQKAINLRNNPQMVLTTGCNEWNEGLDVMIEGEAVQVTDDATLRRLAEAWTTKWDGRWRYEARDGCLHHAAGEAVVFSVRPAKVLAFGKGAFSQTRHQF
jgi:nitroimidazol reductase NimA-like FMN-containing flavoprotein (pyridoxamine 5'-phosphate oxidase superfamily)